jgi:hypothetical protein
VKVTFACEQCGHVLDEQRGTGNFFVIDPTCPNCAKLTYGPLTEEMVAEALKAAYSPVLSLAGYERQARFVLRLVEVMKRIEPSAGYGPMDIPYWRKKLLKIAREI